jgi:hypothetical protein
MSDSQNSFEALNHAAKARYDAIVASAKADLDSTLADIAALRRKLCTTTIPVSPPPTGNGVQKTQPGQSKTERVRKVLSSEYKKVAQLAGECGLTSDEVSHALSQNRIKKLIDRRGIPGQIEYRLKKSVETKPGTTEAILSVLRAHSTGLFKKSLLDEVEKLSSSRSATPRNAIQSTISKMVKDGAIEIDASDVCTVAQ